MSPKFARVDQGLFFTKNDPQDRRMGELAHAVAVQAPEDLNRALASLPDPTRALVLAGYPDDEGIRINGGRPGAAAAPDVVRQYFYKMTPSLLSAAEVGAIVDIGNVTVEGTSLAERHANVHACARIALRAGARWLGIGGGHDYGFPDAAAYVEDSLDRGERPLVLNFDAHLDVRPPTNGLSSGTPFYRLLEAFGDRIDFAEIGIQNHCNSRAHLSWARGRGARVLSLEEWQLSGEALTTSVLRLLDSWVLRRRSAFLSIDIDGFSSAYAMGCSQSWASGLAPDSFFPLLHVLTQRLEVRGMGIYEISPPLDHDNRTAKLGALLLHRFLFPI